MLFHYLWWCNFCPYTVVICLLLAVPFSCRCTIIRWHHVHFRTTRFRETDSFVQITWLKFAKAVCIECCSSSLILFRFSSFNRIRKEFVKDPDLMLRGHLTCKNYEEEEKFRLPWKIWEEMNMQYIYYQILRTFKGKTKYFNIRLVKVCINNIS